MNFSTLLDVGIGLVIIYFIAALLVSGIQEIIASIFQWRSKHLKKAIFQMMLNTLSSEDSSTPQEDSYKFAEGFRDEIYKNSLVQSMNHISFRFPWRGRGKKALDNYESAYKNSNPSYLEAETFATALLEVLKEKEPGLRDKLENLISNPEQADPSKPLSDLKTKIQGSEKIPQSFKDTLCSLADRATIKSQDKKNQLLAFQEEIQAWFNRSMERSSGVYKRNSQLLCFILGFIIAVGLNIDSLSIYQRLLVDTTLRTTLADGGQVIVQNYQSTISEPGEESDTEKAIQSFEDTVSKYVDNTLPIGLIHQNHDNLVDLTECPNPGNNKCPQKKFSFSKFLVALFGWTITTLAIYMGAPFWFDLLGKLVNVRSTGSKPK
jgi:hypothetical protein